MDSAWLESSTVVLQHASDAMQSNMCFPGISSLPSLHNERNYGTKEGRLCMLGLQLMKPGIGQQNCKKKPPQTAL